MQKAWKRMPQWLRDTIMFIFIMGCAVGVCELLSACYDDNNPFATSVFILAVVLVSRFTTGYWPGAMIVFILFCFEFYKLFLRIICVEHRFSKVGLSTINISQSVSASISIVDAVCP